MTKLRTVRKHPMFQPSLYTLGINTETPTQGGWFQKVAAARYSLAY